MKNLNYSLFTIGFVKRLNGGNSPEEHGFVFYKMRIVEVSYHLNNVSASTFVANAQALVTIHAQLIAKTMHSKAICFVSLKIPWRVHKKGIVLARGNCVKWKCSQALHFD